MFSRVGGLVGGLAHLLDLRNSLRRTSLPLVRPGGGMLRACLMRSSGAEAGDTDLGGGRARVRARWARGTEAGDTRVLGHSPLVPATVLAVLVLLAWRCTFLALEPLPGHLVGLEVLQQCVLNKVEKQCKSLNLCPV